MESEVFILHGCAGPLHLTKEMDRIEHTLQSDQNAEPGIQDSATGPNTADY